MKIINVLTEYLNNPIGIDIKHPRITWNIEGIITQQAFEIIYKINNVSYSSGVIKSSSMNYIFEDDLNSRDQVTYQIRVLDQDNNWSELSNEYRFEMGLLEESNWVGHWISGNYKVNKNIRYPADYFKKEFNVSKIKKARLYISACGVYEAKINDVRVGDFVLAPGSTDYRKRIQYQTYDVSSLIKEGNNEITIILGDGWYRGSIGAKGFTNVFGKQTKVKAQLEIELEDGNVTIVTDESWKWSNDGPIVFNDFKDGEIVNANKEASYAFTAKVVKFTANLKASNNAFVKEQENNLPIRIFKSKTNKTIVEFPNNVAGYISFDVSAHKGDKIDISLGEMIDDNDDVSLTNIQCVRKNKKTPLQEIHYICKEGNNNYHSKFFVAGFKYASIDSNVEFKKEDIHQIAIYTDIEETSTFHSSNELINIFYDNTIRSLKSNSIDVPTDCPTRERMGWTGDSQLFFEASSYLTNYASFMRKHIEDVFDRQSKNGCLPQIAPYNAEDWFMSVMNGSVGWADIGILVPYRFYKKYRDKRLLENHFDDIERYAKFMINRCGPAKGLYAIYAKPLHLSKENRKYGVNTGQSYGEWAEPNDVKAFVWTDFAMPHPEESMAYTSWMMSLMVEICEILNRNENKALYQKYALGVKKAYQELVNKKEYSLDTDRQAKLVRPLYLDLLTDSQKEFAKKRLIKALDNYSWRLGTGFLSTPFILYVLQDIDPELSYRLLENEELPGWLYMAKNNTGTIWEGWEGPNSQSGIASLNHYSKGAMVEWLYKSMLGISIDKENEITIAPIIGGKETYAKGSYKSIYGHISSSWVKNKDKVIFDIEIPGNVKATFKYKDITKVLLSGKYHFEA